VSTLRAHLWREWREHRFALGALAVLLPLALATTAFTLPRATLRTPLFATVSALAALLAMLLAVGGELLGERRGPGLCWLERLPGGLAAAFRAKLVFFVAGTLVASGYGYLLAVALAWLRGVPPSSAGETSLAVYVLLPVALGLWTFACSAWTLRGGLSLLAAGLIVSGAAFPCWWLPHEGFAYRAYETALAFVLLVLGALVSARAAFVRGSRHGRGRLETTLVGLAFGLPLLSLIWGHALLQVCARAHVDPIQADFSIEDAFVTEDGTRALVGGRHCLERWEQDSMPWQALVIDLDQGRWQRAGEQGASFVVTYDVESPAGTSQPDGVLLVPEEGPSSIEFDPRTGEQRSVEPVWVGGDIFRVGLGVLVSAGGKKRIFDPFRQRYFDEPPAYWWDTLVLPGRWLYQDEHLLWQWFDPDTGLSEAVGWTSDDEVDSILPDGRLLLRTWKDEPISWFVFDTAEGTRQELELPGTDSDIYYRSTKVFQPNEPAVIDNGSALFLLDLATLATQRLDAPRTTVFLRTFEDGTAIVLDERQRFVRLELATGRSEILFPPEP
jgi:hypothetical protein